MNKNWAKITKSIFDQDPSRNVYIYSNATICPKGRDLELSGEKIFTFTLLIMMTYLKIWIKL